MVLGVGRGGFLLSFIHSFVFCLFVCFRGCSEEEGLSTQNSHLSGLQMVAGLQLLGFKPLSSLKDWHQLRTASFLYPAEKARPGSTTAFIALHEALLAKEAFALCSFTRTRVAESRLVACLPQQELVDESGIQAKPFLHCPLFECLGS